MHGCMGAPKANRLLRQSCQHLKKNYRNTFLLCTQQAIVEFLKLGVGHSFKIGVALQEAYH